MKAAAPKAESTAPSTTATTTPAQPKSAPARATGERGERRERMSNLRKTIARRLVQVKNDTAMLTTFNEVDMSGIMALRAQYKDKFKEKYGVGLGFMSFRSEEHTSELQSLMRTSYA